MSRHRGSLGWRWHAAVMARIMLPLVAGTGNDGDGNDGDGKDGNCKDGDGNDGDGNDGDGKDGNCKDGNHDVAVMAQTMLLNAAAGLSTWQMWQWRLWQ